MLAQYEADYNQMLHAEARGQLGVTVDTWKPILPQPLITFQALCSAETKPIPDIVSTSHKRMQTMYAIYNYASA